MGGRSQVRSAAGVALPFLAGGPDAPFCPWRSVRARVAKWCWCLTIWRDGSKTNGNPRDTNTGSQDVLGSERHFSMMTLIPETTPICHSLNLLSDTHWFGSFLKQHNCRRFFLLLFKHELLVLTLLFLTACNKNKTRVPTKKSYHPTKESIPKTQSTAAERLLEKQAWSQVYRFQLVFFTFFALCHGDWPWRTCSNPSCHTWFHLGSFEAVHYSEKLTCIFFKFYPLWKRDQGVSDKEKNKLAK